MTQQRESVVTPERFASGMTWEQYLGHIQRNREKFEHNYQETVLTEEDVAAFRRLLQLPGGPARVLALAEEWCPDVFRGLPVLARIAQAAGMELRVFPRDQNLDIMNEFLNQGQYQSIPTFVFYTGDHRYIAHWSERPAQANAEMDEMRKLFEGRSREEAQPLYEKFQRGPIWAGWRQAMVRELRQMLEEKCRQQKR